MADAPKLASRVAAVLETYESLAVQLADPTVLADPALLRGVAQQHSDLTPLADAGRAYLKMLDDLAQARELVGSSEPELATMARLEAESLSEELEGVEERLRALLVPRDPLDDRPAVVEVRAGTGGDEAGLFAADLYRMYDRYADARGWAVEVLSSNEGTLGGLKEIIFLVRGRDAYGALRYESGVHRVQRVPVTESSGRIHTSAASVAVLPEAEEVDVEIDPGDLKIDVFRSSGPGGQSVNTTDSAVRITHAPTGLVVSCQDEKSQHKNKARAMKILRSRLLDLEIQRQQSERADARRGQIGSGGRSERIRTYNFPQNRVTDHRVNLTLHKLSDILEGNLTELFEGVEVQLQAEAMAQVEGP